MNDIKIIVKGWVKLLPFYLFTLLLLFISCSEKDDAVEEYPDWKNKNDKFFENAYQAHDYDIALKKFSLMESVTAAHTDYVLVDVIEEGYGGESPYLTDSVLVHYAGHLIPSSTYTEGFPFDQSYQEPFDYDTAVPSAMALNNTRIGFATALQKMHRGDYWRVTIPYQMGYGASGTSDGLIPGYSTLIFDIRLEDFWTKKRGDRD